MIEDFFHLLRISPRIFEKIETALMVYSGAWGKLIHEKTRSRKSRDTVPLKHANTFLPDIEYCGDSWYVDR